MRVRLFHPGLRNTVHHCQRIAGQARDLIVACRRHLIEPLADRRRDLLVARKLLKPALHRLQPAHGRADPGAQQQPCERTPGQCREQRRQQYGAWIKRRERGPLHQNLRPLRIAIPLDRLDLARIVALSEQKAPRAHAAFAERTGDQRVVPDQMQFGSRKRSLAQKVIVDRVIQRQRAEAIASQQDRLIQQPIDHIGLRIAPPARSSCPLPSGGRSAGGGRGEPESDLVTRIENLRNSKLNGVALRCNEADQRRRHAAGIVGQVRKFDLALECKRVTLPMQFDLSDAARDKLARMRKLGLCGLAIGRAKHPNAGRCRRQSRDQHGDQKTNSSLALQ